MYIYENIHIYNIIGSSSSGGGGLDQAESKEDTADDDLLSGRAVIWLFMFLCFFIFLLCFV
jgi:hypothetical protein